jgi:hypothetical protein
LKRDRRQPVSIVQDAFISQYRKTSIHAGSHSVASRKTMTLIAARRLARSQVRAFQSCFGDFEGIAFGTPELIMRPMIRASSEDVLKHRHRAGTVAHEAFKGAESALSACC